MRVLRVQDRPRGLSLPPSPPPPQRIIRPGGGHGTPPEILHPISLYATTTLRPNQGDGVNTLSLKNPKDLPMEILEVKFMIQESTTVFDLTGASVTCLLSLGKLKVTNDYIPLWVFGQSPQVVDEFLIGTAAVGNVYGNFSWRLPRPLYIPPGAVLVPSFQHTGQAANPITVHVVYSGRVLKRPLDENRPFPVPYVAAYTSLAFDVALAGTDSSKETDLINSTGVDLHVCRMAGRISSTAGGSTTELNHEDELIQVDMTDSRGYPWVPYPTAFRQVFSGVTRSWELPIEPVLPAGHYVTANITKNVPTNNAPSQGASYDQVGISLVGWRDVTGAEAT